MDGITIVAVLPPKEKKAEPGRVEIIGPPRAATPDVTTSLTRPLRDGDDGSRRPRRDGGPARNGAAPSGRGGPREGGENPDRPRPARSEGSDRGAGGPRPPRQDRARIDRGSRPGGPITTGGAPGGTERSPRRSLRPGPAAAAASPRRDGGRWRRSRFTKHGPRCPLERRRPRCPHRRWPRSPVWRRLRRDRQRVWSLWWRLRRDRQRVWSFWRRLRRRARCGHSGRRGPDRRTWYLTRWAGTAEGPAAQPG